jgi:hypothetical protein
MKRQPGTASPAPTAEPAALVLSRQARPGRERAFEEVLHSLAEPANGAPPAPKGAYGQVH